MSAGHFCAQCAVDKNRHAKGGIEFQWCEKGMCACLMRGDEGAGVAGERGGHGAEDEDGREEHGVLAHVLLVGCLGGFLEGGSKMMIADLSAAPHTRGTTSDANTLFGPVGPSSAAKKSHSDGEKTSFLITILLFSIGVRERQRRE